MGVVVGHLVGDLQAVGAKLLVGVDGVEVGHFGEHVLGDFELDLSVALW